MQKKLVSIFSAALFVVLLQACSDDDKKSGSSFTYDGKTSGLTKGYVDYDLDYEYTWDPVTEQNIETEVHLHEIVLLSKGFTLTGENITGKGDAIIVEVRSEGQELANGTYQFVDEGPEVGNMTEGVILRNFDVEQEGGEDAEIYEDCSSGQVTIERNDGKFKLTFSGIINGEAFTGTYSGALSEWE